ncbi:MAG: M24 family metallopeptidase [Alphaproteobacteria bacterium]|nr:M24 family metallopeptidase [Alphaproteobacteria bacterium]
MTSCKNAVKEIDLLPAERIAALRGELLNQELDGFLVPLSDEHQSEFPPKRAQRLAWLSDFTGSAGIAVVLKDKAALFVDGRYTLQVREQADPSIYEFCSISDDPPGSWIVKNASAGSRIGYDPWLHTKTGVTQLETKCRVAQIELVQIEANPLDAAWDDQPPAPLAPVYPHPVEIAGRSTEEKLAEVAATIRGSGAKAAVLTAPDSIAWLLNIRGGDLPNTPVALGFAILSAAESVEWFVDARKVTSAALDTFGENISLRPVDEFGVALATLGAANAAVLIAPSTAPVWVSNHLEAVGAEIIAKDDPCVLPKACKNTVEIQGVRNAHIRDGAALCSFLAWLSEAGRTGDVDELSAVDKLLGFRVGGEKYRGLSFDTISGAGPNGAVVHYRVTPETNRKLDLGSLFLVDSGAQYLDGTTDVTRTVAIGPPTEEMRDRFTRVLKGHAGIATARFPVGTSGGQLDSLARQPLWDVGLDFEHGTGHGVGAYLGVHEGPHRIAKRSADVPLQPGMIVSNEPGYYKEGAFGIRIENLEVVRAAPIDEPGDDSREMLQFEALTLAPIDLALVDASIMTTDEIDWLNGYHARVQATIGPLVDQKTAAWLLEATQPLSPADQI